MRILCIGDVVGSIGCEFLRNNLPTLKKVKGVDFVICNGENSADGNGLTPVSAKHLFDRCNYTRQPFFPQKRSL